MISSEVMTITPSVAREFLKRNEANRSISSATVDKYCVDMKRGNWELNGEPIVFFEDGRLKDGQHRLMAVMKANTPVEMLVVRGVPNTSKFHDGGRKRSVRDIMMLEGYSATLRDTTTVGAVNFLLSRFAGAEYRHPTAHQVMDFMSQHKDVISQAAGLTINGHSSTLTKKSPVEAAVICALASGAKYDDIKAFCKIVNTGFYENENQTAAIVFRNFLLSPGKYEPTLFAGHGKPAQNRTFEVCLLALSDFMEGIKRNKFYYKSAKGLATIREMAKVFGWELPKEEEASW